MRARAKGKPIKTNKHQTLLLIRERGAVHSWDLVENFRYSPGTARSYLSYLAKQALVERMGPGHQLTDKGEERLHHFEIFGCSDIECPLCQGKIGYLTCPHCNHQMRKDNVRIRKEKDNWFAVRHAGVYCHSCLNLIFNEPQARLLGIKMEA
jgi:predicted methyltransferase